MRSPLFSSQRSLLLSSLAGILTSATVVTLAPATVLAQDAQPQSVGTDGCNVQIENLKIKKATDHKLVVKFKTIPKTAATTEVWLNDSRLNDDDAVLLKSKSTGAKKQHKAKFKKLSSDSRVMVKVQAGCASATIEAATEAPTWSDPAICPEGDTLFQLRDSDFAEWRVFTDNNSSAVSSLSRSPDPDLVRLDYQFNEASCIIAVPPVREAFDITAYSHICVPVNGNASGPDVAMTLNLIGPDLDDPTKEAQAWVRTEELTDLPARRALLLDLRRFVPQVGNLDFSQVTAVRFGVSCRLDGVWSACPDIGVAGNLDVGDIVGFDAKHRVGKQRRLDVVSYRPDQLAAIEDATLAQSQTCGPLVATYPTESFSPLRYTYSNSMALTVLARGAARTGDIALSEATAELANEYIGLQEADGGFCEYVYEQGCGDFIKPISCRRYVGASAWMGIALLEARNTLGSEALPSVDAALESLATSIASSEMTDDENNLTGQLTNSTEAHVSVWLFLNAAQKSGLAMDHVAFAQRLAGHIDSMWDSRLGYLRTSVTNYDTATDLTAGVGKAYLLARGKKNKALRSASYARTWFATTSFDGTLEGISDYLGPWTVTAEWGVGQYATYGGPDAEFLVKRYLEEKSDNGLVNEGADNFSNNLFSYSADTPSVVAAAWLYHAIEGRYFPIGNPNE